MTRRDPAAPYADSVSAVPRNKVNSNSSVTKKRAVNVASIHTSLHAILASGRILVDQSKEQCNDSERGDQIHVGPDESSFGKESIYVDALELTDGAHQK